MIKETSFKNSFGDTLFGNEWLVDKPKGVIIIVTGMAEHSERYDDFASFLNKHYMNVISLDHYGQGKNGNLGHGAVDFFSKYTKTVDELALKMKDEYNLPVYLFSHSMGSFIAQSYIENYHNLDKVVICGTNYMGAMGGLGFFVAKLVVTKKNREDPAGLLNSLAIGAYEKSCKGEDSKNAWLSYNKDNYHAYDKDPLSGYHCSNGFYYEFTKGLASLNKKAKLKTINKNLPIFIIGGDHDVVGKNGAGPTKLNDLYQKYDLNSELKLYKNMKHEILNEDNKMDVYKDVVNFYKGK
jgi:Lysophospholipase